MNASFADDRPMKPTVHFQPASRLLLPGMLLVLLVSAFLTGCGRYHLGQHSKPPFRSVYVKPVSNESYAPQLHSLISGKIAEEIARNGLVRIGSEGDADVTLDVTIREYNREIGATRSEDTVIAAKLNLDLVAVCTLTDNRTGETFFKDRPVRAGSHVYPEQNPLESALQAEYQSIPILAESLARDVSRTVLQTW